MINEKLTQHVTQQFRNMLRMSGLNADVSVTAETLAIQPPAPNKLRLTLHPIDSLPWWLGETIDLSMPFSVKPEIAGEIIFARLRDASVRLIQAWRAQTIKAAEKTCDALDEMRAPKVDVKRARELWAILSKPVPKDGLEPFGDVLAKGDAEKEWEPMVPALLDAAEAGQRVSKAPPARHTDLIDAVTAWALEEYRLTAKTPEPIIISTAIGYVEVRRVDPS